MGFVFLWTPAIASDKHPDAPFGLIFALFMIGCMSGSCLFQMLTTTVSNSEKTIFGTKTLTPFECLCAVTSVSAVMHGLIIVSDSPMVILSAFTIFEVSVGMYFPAMGVLKSRLVPEASRSAIYNFFRVPLNLIVALALIINPSVSTGFGFTTVLLCSCVYMLKLLQEKGLEADKSRGAPEDAATMVSQ